MDDPFYNPLLTEYYNTPEGKAKLESDFEYLTEEGTSLNISVWTDDVLIVMIKFEDSTYLAEDTGERLQLLLNGQYDNIVILSYLYNTEIIGPASVREIIIQYTDPDDNVLAELIYSGQ